ncbi:DUF1648 domain-containing protein [Allokutzneria sp. NRRL B-24872]|uniref:DUF1648 domain-containing protein n=1 Tax=Allokutzneria sp. NRRL B-24872 TaxID=1137961 RepID=UPI000A3C17BB|nr:DUF1648 domain-containing protein [Allokutzneria sp. NRRL B-24872]
MHSPKFARRLLLALAAPLLALGATWLMWSALADRLPDRLATHFGPSGDADGFMAKDGFLLKTGPLIGVLGIALVVMVVAMRRNPHGQRFAVTCSFALSALFGLMHMQILWGNADATDASTVVLSWWTLLLVLVAAPIAGALGYVLAGHVPAPERTEPLPEDAPRIPLAATERASWSQTITTPLCLLGGGVLFFVGAGLGATLAWPAMIAILPALLLFLSASVRVIVNGTGMTVRPSLISWPRKRIALVEIAVVHVKKIRPFRDFGGWGYRFNGAASGVVLRAGDAIVVELTNGSEFVVTVDDAHTAAALLNSLAERARTGD